MPLDIGTLSRSLSLALGGLARPPLGPKLIRDQPGWSHKIAPNLARMSPTFRLIWNNCLIDEFVFVFGWKM